MGMTSSHKKEEGESVFDVRVSQRNRRRPEIFLKTLLYGKNVLNLKPKFRIRHPWLTAIYILVVVIVILLGVRQFFVRAEIVDFYPTACLGTWQSPQNAQGRPENLDLASSTFDVTNSAIFSDSSTQIFCGGFLSPDFKPVGNIKRVGVTLIWDASGGSENVQAVVSSSTPSSTQTQEETTTAPSSFLWSPFTIAFAQEAAAPQDTSTPITPVDTSTPILDVGSVSSSTSAPSSNVSLPSDTTASDTQEVSQSSSTPLASSSEAAASDTTTDASATASSSSSSVILMPPLTVTLSPLTTSSEAATTTTSTTTTSTIEVAPVVPPSLDNNFLEVSYSLDGTQWTNLTKVDRNNLKNLTISLPITNWDDLGKLQLKVSGIPTLLADVPTVFLDGMVVETEYEVPPIMIGTNPRATADTSASADSSVIVLPPQSAPLPVGSSTDFKADESPTFDLDLNGLPAATSSLPPPAPATTTGPSSFLRGVSRAIALAANFFLNILPSGNSAHAQTAPPDNGDFPTAEHPVVAEVYDPGQQITDLQPTFVFVGTTLRIILPQPGKQFHPGAYSMKLWVWRNGAVYYSENIFNWGVLAVNFNKSIYSLGDTAKLGFSVLTNQGHTVCDATIDVTITSPQNKVLHLSTSDRTIVRNPTCGPRTVTNEPDYSATIPAAEIGTYQATIVAETGDGRRQIADSFEVQDEPLFDVERSAPTRIYPPANYGVTFHIKANQDFAGQVTETVPATFEITAPDASNQQISGDDQRIAWDVNWKN